MPSLLTKAAAAVVVSLVMKPLASWALIAIPLGVPVGSAVDLFSVTGLFTLADNSPPPYATAVFTLSFDVPAEVTITYPIANNVFSVPITNGSYVDGQTVVAFANQTATFASASLVTLTAQPADASGDSLFFNFQGSGAFYTSPDGGYTEIFAPGTYSIVSGTSVDESDPSFTGTVTISPVAAVPEPASFVILGSALAGFGLLRRRRN